MPGLTVPLKSVLGTKRMRVLASEASSRAVASVGEPNGVQTPPLLIVNCQTPSVLSTAVIASPCLAPLSASWIFVPPKAAMIDDTAVPGFVVSSSLMAVKAGAPLLSRVGASLAAVTLIVLVGVVLLLSPSLTVHETVRAAIDGLSDVLWYFTARKAA